MRFKAVALLTMAAVAIVTTAVSASERIPVEAGLVAQKSVFLERLVTDSFSSRTITQSGDLGAIAKLEDSRRLVEEAKSLLSDGDFAQADQKLDRALGLVNVEARRLSVKDIKKRREEEAFEKRRHTVEVFLSAYERVSDASPAGTTIQHAEIIKRLMAEADALKKAKHYEKALAMLDRAYEITRGDIRTAREGQTLVRSLVFDTPKDAYEYELGRTASHFLLLEFAIENKRPAPSLLKGMESKRGGAKELRANAKKKAAEGNYVAAIGDLEAATEELLKGIRMSGFFIPG